jgi:hypothetical protein
MNIQVFLHYMKGGCFHAGVRFDDEVKYVRSLEPLDTKLLAFIDVYLNDSAPRSISSLHQVIEEAFIKIGIPEEAQFYAQQTSLGTLEFLFRPPFAKNAAEAKSVVDKVLGLICEHPFA